jgi:predicted amidophosphoribosyltransferase
MKILEWEGSPLNNPCCKGHGKGWSLSETNGYWSCAECGKPGQANLKLCPACEEVWLPPASLLLTNFFYENFTERFPRELIHLDCM